MSSHRSVEKRCLRHGSEGRDDTALGCEGLLLHRRGRCSGGSLHAVLVGGHVVLHVTDLQGELVGGLDDGCGGGGGSRVRRMMSAGTSLQLVQSIGGGGLEGRR